MATNSREKEVGPYQKELTEYDKERLPHELLNAHQQIDRSALLKTVNSQIICPICLDVLQNTMVTSCLHRFCRDCISNSLLRSNRECPTCREKVISKRNLRADPNWDALVHALVPDRSVYEHWQTEQNKASMEGIKAMQRGIQEGMRDQAKMARINNRQKAENDAGSGVGGTSSDNNNNGAQQEILNPIENVDETNAGIAAALENQPHQSKAVTLLPTTTTVQQQQKNKGRQRRSVTLATPDSGIAMEERSPITTRSETAKFEKQLAEKERQQQQLALATPPLTNNTGRNEFAYSPSDFNSSGDSATTNDDWSTSGKSSSNSSAEESTNSDESYSAKEADFKSDSSGGSGGGGGFGDGQEEEEEDDDDFKSPPRKKPARSAASHTTTSTTYSIQSSTQLPCPRKFGDQPEPKSFLDFAFGKCKSMDMDPVMKEFVKSRCPLGDVKLRLKPLLGVRAAINGTTAFQVTLQHNCTVNNLMYKFAGMHPSGGTKENLKMPTLLIETPSKELMELHGEESICTVLALADRPAFHDYPIVYFTF